MGFQHYILEVNTKVSTWTVEYRYSQFRELHRMLLNIYKKELGQVEIAFPERKWYKKEARIRDDRQKQLDSYVKKLVEVIDVTEESVLA